MTPMQSMEFVSKELCGLFPRWDATNIQKEIWAERLEKYDYGMAKEGLKRYYATAPGRYLDPKISAVTYYIDRLYVTKFPEKADGKDDLDDGFYVRDIEKGFLHSVIVMPRNKRHDKEYCQSYALEMAFRYKEAYGGIWEIVTEERYLAELAEKYAGCKTLSEMMAKHDIVPVERPKTAVKKSSKAEIAEALAELKKTEPSRQTEPESFEEKYQLNGELDEEVPF